MFRNVAITLSLVSVFTFAPGCEEAAVDSAEDTASLTELQIEEIVDDSQEIDLGEDDQRCGITFRADWSTSTPLTDEEIESIDMSVIKGKIYGGTWATFTPSGFVLEYPGDSASASVSTTFGCSVRRRWHVYATAVDTDGSSYTQDWYYPSSTSWTTATTINLGNVAAYFD